MAEKRKWTDEQSLAINTRDRTLLISAAAGSGKTATLTERIIRSLLDEERPENINEILIVTFTRAAVAELRERIGKALRDALAENPDNERLRAQLALLPGAKIQTIDSFCIDILRRNCDKVGVSPGFRIPDAAEARLLALSTIERIIDAVYDGLLPEVATPEEFEELADGLTDTRGMSELSEVLLGLYDDLVDVEEGVDAIAHLAEQYDNGKNGGIAGSTVFKYAIGRVKEMAAHYTHLYCRALSGLNPATDKSGKFSEMCRIELEYLGTIERAEDYSSLRRTLVETERIKKPSLSASSSEEARFASSVYYALSEDVEFFREKIFFMREDALLSLFDALYRRVSVLHRFLSHFDKTFMREKRRLAICEYSDVERYAYDCLWDGAPTETARSEAARYSSVYIDEYQDVNGIQNRIFEAVSRPDNRFMVGDIKQSIYGFRGARPEIFADMKKRFPEFADSGAGGSASIFMSRNFRSESPVIDFVNEVFDKLFDMTKDSIGYREGDRLECGRGRTEGGPYPEIHILPKLSAAANREAEPQFVSELIADLIYGEKTADEAIQPSDVAVLLRSDVGRISDFTTALSERAIPARLPDNESFFFNAEILLAMSLLSAVDNPRRDIYLAGLMRSPLFDFSLDELIRIRRSSEAQSLYDALLEYCEENPEYTRGLEFIKALQKYRRIAEGRPVDEVIARLYRETGLMSVASDAARANLDLLYEYARGFEASSFKGLYNFIRYLNNVINRAMSLDEKQEAYADGTVKVITAHKSKGLEFPVVVLADTAKSLSGRDTGRLHYAASFGISMTVRTESGLAILENPVNRIISHYTSRLDFEEELRILYVALTRAKRRLYVVGTSPNVKTEDFIEKIDFLKETLSPYSVYKIPSYLAAVLVSGGVTAKTVFEGAPVTVKSDDEPTDECADIEEITVEPTFTEEELLQRFDFVYPNPELTTLPRKLSVSRLHPAVLDGSAEELHILTDADRGVNAEAEKSATRPKFLLDTDPDDSAKRGIATHLFMQFCNLENLAENGARAELDRLVCEKFISTEDSARVRLDEIELFCRSRLIGQMLGAKKIHRELRFNLRFPAWRFTKEEQKREAYAEKKVLVQGVIDCIVELDDGSLLLIDYKTDRLTKKELSNRALAVEKLTRSHASQLSYYRMAVREMFGKEPSSVAVYSLPLGDTVEIDFAKM